MNFPTNGRQKVAY